MLVVSMRDMPVQTNILLIHFNSKKKGVRYSRIRNEARNQKYSANLNCQISNLKHCATWGSGFSFNKFVKKCSSLRETKQKVIHIAITIPICFYNTNGNTSCEPSMKTFWIRSIETVFEEKLWGKVSLPNTLTRPSPKKENIAPTPQFTIKLKQNNTHGA